MLPTQKHSPVCSVLDFIWHKQVPLKVSIVAWRLLRDRLPTKANLAKRGIITTTDRFCVVGCGHEEYVHLSFLSCSAFGTLWQLVRSWIGFDGAYFQVITNHFQQFIYYTGGLKSRRSFL
jgi:hypothetical protein